jgi:hypothetical protein
VELQYTITLEEFIEGSKLWAKAVERKRRTSLFESWRGLVYLVFLLATGLLIVQLRGWALAWALISLVGISAISIVFQQLICPRLFRSGYEEQKPGLSLRIVIGEAGVESERAGGEASGRCRWTAFTRYLEAENTFVLYLNRLQFMIIPKRAMTPEQQQEFRLLLAPHIASAGSR